MSTSADDCLPPSLKLFGTDGIRGIANVPPLTSEIILQVGRAVAHHVKQTDGPHKILIGKDTRLSGYMLEWALASGINSMGVDVLLVGPLPTPGIAFLTVSMRADAGIVISASHNPFQDNGIKIFSRAGYKLPPEEERAIEELVHSRSLDALRPTATEIGKAHRVDDATGRYIQFSKTTFPSLMTLDGLTIALDCAHGAAYRAAPTVLEELGARVIAIGVEPDGENINDGVGSLYPEAVAEVVKREGADLGIALDGDADRVIMIDEKGNVIDGDRIMAVCALSMAEKGALKQNAVVGTVMSNMGLEVFLRERGIRFVRAPVGDRFVVKAMRDGGYNFGGEQSGHVIFLDHCTTGDGIVGALQVMAVMLQTGAPLSHVAHAFERYPQVLRNVRVREKQDFAAVPQLTTTIDAVTKELGESGRVLVRYSGTEPVARVMLEGTDAEKIEALCSDIVTVIEKHLGADT